MTCQSNLAVTTFNVVLEAFAQKVSVLPNVSPLTRIVCPMKFARKESARGFAAATNSVEIAKFALTECVSKDA